MKLSDDQIVARLRRGHSLKTIAAEAEITFSKFQHHIIKLRQKVGARNVVHLTWLWPLELKPLKWANVGGEFWASTCIAKIIVRRVGANWQMEEDLSRTVTSYPTEKAAKTAAEEFIRSRVTDTLSEFR